MTWNPAVPKDTPKTTSIHIFYVCYQDCCCSCHLNNSFYSFEELTGWLQIRNFYLIYTQMWLKPYEEFGDLYIFFNIENPLRMESYTLKHEKICHFSTFLGCLDTRGIMSNIWCWRKKIVFKTLNKSIFFVNWTVQKLSSELLLQLWFLNHIFKGENINLLSSFPTKFLVKIFLHLCFDREITLSCVERDCAFVKFKAHYANQVTAQQDGGGKIWRH